MKKLFLVAVIFLTSCDLFEKNDNSDQSDSSESIEYAYDDGSSEMAVSPWSDDPGVMITVKFTPVKYPSKIKDVSFYITGHGKPSTEFRIKIFSENSSTFMPDTNILNADVRASAVSGNEWVTVNLEQYDVILASGSCFAAMEWLTAPNSTDGSGAQFIGTDLNLPDFKSYIYDISSADEWFVFGTSIGAPADGDFMVRVNME